MDKIRLGLVGCGGMGTRHLYGLRELVQSPFSNVELCAVCDIRRENAELAALEAEKLMGVRPEISPTWRRWHVLCPTSPPQTW